MLRDLLGAIICVSAPPPYNQVIELNMKSMLSTVSHPTFTVFYCLILCLLVVNIVFIGHVFCLLTHCLLMILFIHGYVNVYVI